MNQRARVVILAIVGGVATAASAIAVEALIGVAALILLILGSTLAIGNAIAADSSEPAGGRYRLQPVKLVASNSSNGGAPIVVHRPSGPEVALLSLEVDDGEGRATPGLPARAGGRR